MLKGDAMPYRVFWDSEEETIVHHTLDEQWTVMDYLNGLRDTHLLMNEKPYTVHVIVDLTTSKGYPTNLLSMHRTVESSVPNNQGVVVGVKVGMYLTTLIGVVSKFAPKATKNLYFTNSVEEAHAIIKQHEQKERQA